MGCHRNDEQPEPVLKQPSVYQYLRSRIGVPYEHHSVNVEQSQHEQEKYRHADRDAVQIVEVDEGASDELMPHPEQFNDVGHAVRAGSGERRAAVAGPRTHAADAADFSGAQRGRIPTRVDRLDLQRGHVLVDRPEQLVQPETPYHEMYFHGTNAQALRVHHHEEQQNVGVVRMMVDQIDPVRVHGQYDRRVREHDGRGEPNEVFPFRSWTF